MTSWWILHEACIWSSQGLAFLYHKWNKKKLSKLAITIARCFAATHQSVIKNKRQSVTDDKVNLERSLVIWPWSSYVTKWMTKRWKKFKKHLFKLPVAAGDVHFIFHCVSGVYSCMCFSPSKFRCKNSYSSNCDCAIFNKILWYQMFNLMANWMTVLYSPRCSRFWSFLAVANLIKV